MPGFRITGWGIGLPDKVVTNADLEKTLDTNDAWIVERSGIRERRIGGTTSSLAILAGAAAMEKAGVSGADIDCLILATTTPDQAVPATSSTVQAALDIAGGAFDINAACSGFVYAMVIANGLFLTGAKRILLIGSETLSTITDQSDRSTAVLFADGAGALVLEATEGDGALQSWDLGSDGSLNHILYAPLGGYIQMEGKEVFRRAVRMVVDSAEKVLKDANVDAADLALVVPHQANIRIIQAVCQRLGVEDERAAIVLDRYGNTSSASIPLALVDAIDKGRLSSGDLLLLTGFGAGMTYASAVLRWQ